MSSIPFERYDEEFASLSSQIKSTLTRLENCNGNLSTTLDIESLQNNQKDVENDLKLATNLLAQAQDLLQQMTIEARGIPSLEKERKQSCLQKVRVCKGNLANLNDDVEKARHEHNRDSLLSSGGGDKGFKKNKNGSRLSDDTKERLLSTNSQLQSQNTTLDNARRIMAETEEVAMDITSELARNRETMESASGRVRDVSSLTNQARRVLVSMQRREVQQKMIVYGVGVFLFIMVLFLFGFL